MMKIQQSRCDYGGESHKELESLLRSIPRQELRIETLGKSELDLLEWRMRALSIGECKCQEWRTIRGGGVYIGLSQEFSCWTKMQNPDKVWGEADIVRLEVSIYGWI
jgi:hypothetical protein